MHIGAHQAVGLAALQSRQYSRHRLGTGMLDHQQLYRMTVYVIPRQDTVRLRAKFQPQAVVLVLLATATPCSIGGLSTIPR
jgi:hypothetical protein